MQKSIATNPVSGRPVVTGSIVLDDVHKIYPMFRSPLDRLRSAFGVGAAPISQFTALKGVSLTIEPAETIGILGVNGAGKSTLLGIIAGVIEPSQGRVAVGGRITALLELGAGFNPEWSGRQNVEFYGIMHGFTPAEARARIPPIEAFADIGVHFDQPMRTYSSGMFMRVAFAAAIHVDPDILIVDEALAVGDSRFQNKCFREFEKFKAAGKTIVLVTHSPELVVQNCTRAIVLSQGEVVIDGAPVDGVNFYLKLLYGSKNADQRKPICPPQDALPEPESGAILEGGRSEVRFDPLFSQFLELGAASSDKAATRGYYNKNEFRYGTGDASIVDFVILSGDKETNLFKSGETLTVLMKVSFNKDCVRPAYGIVIKTVNNVRLYGSASTMQGIIAPAAREGDIVFVRIDCSIPVASGDLFLDLGVGVIDIDDVFVHDARNSVGTLVVTADNSFNGLVNLRASFHITPLDAPAAPFR